MEKKAYTVEWLSESSHKKTISTLPDVDLLKCRMGQDFSYGKEHNTSSEMEKPTAGEDFNEKENHINNKNALHQPLNTEQDTPGMSKSRKALQEVSAQRPSPVNEQCPHSDSESMRSPGSISDEESSSRHRTKFTIEQLNELEKSFREHHYIGSSEKKRLSKVLRLSETQIKTWFQNRRMKHKRQSQEARVDAFISGLYLPFYNYTDFQGPTYPVQPDMTVPLVPTAPAHPTPVHPVPFRPAPVHPYGALPTQVIRPPIHTAPIAVPNFGSYPYPSMLGYRYHPY